MPTYEYKCKKDHPYVEVRGINEEQKRLTCAAKGCNDKLLRVFSAPPISFKGVGFSKNYG